MYSFLCSKKFYFTFLSLFFSAVLFAQTGTIKGTVKTSDGQPAEFVTIALNGATRGTTVNQKGNYQLKNVSPGNYTLTASFIGLITQNKEVELKAGETLTVDFVLAENNEQLQEVVVKGAKTNKFANKKSELVARMPLANLENPQVYSVVTKELLQEQVATNISQATSNITGAAPNTYPAGGFAITSRGFITGINARNGMETVDSRSGLDIGNIERIEVLKGPSGTLFGANISSFGGVVNVVTKRPYDTFGGSASYTLGSYGLNRVSADVNAPLNSERTALVRINTAVNRQNSFLTNGHNNTVLIAPSLSYQVSDRLKLSADLEYFNTDQTRIMYTRVTPASGITSADQIPLAYNKSLYLDDANALTSSNKIFLEGKYRISDNWTATTLFSFVSENVKQSYQYYPTWISPTKVARNVVLYGPMFNNYTNFQENINGEFKTGAIKHKVLIGLSYRYYNGNFYSTFTPANRFIDTVDVNKTSNPVAVGKAKVDEYFLKYGMLAPFGVSDQFTTSAYATDVISLNERLFAMLGLRFDHYRYKGYTSPSVSSPYTQNSVAPKLGLVYQAVKDQVSLFGNYMSGFQNIAPVQQPDGTLFVVKPIFANQTEGGIKTEAFEKKVNLTLSYYYTNIANATRTDSKGFTFQDGRQVSKGVDAELIANPLPGLNIIMGYAYNNNKILKTTNPVLEGNMAATAPARIANWWVSYRFQQTLKNVGIGFGGNYVSKAFLTADNTYSLPHYTILNAAVFYDQPKWRFDFKVNNLAKQKYWDLAGSAQPLANIAANLTIKF
ncbi:TonB-dependent siderophore receptor [Mucilaginibacter sp. R-33]|uniref:TonB-dependent siderophore receptor n=1 Tax=Mucilaginibacter sp. R-33 TaxID=3416711 RepID=UPI003CF7998F